MFTMTQQIAAMLIPVLLAITLHEAAHAYVANLCGDSTAKSLGRLSINPGRHIDLVGTIIMPILMAVLTQFHFLFGWAKPVPVNWGRLRNPRRDMALVALAGPMSNFLMCVFWGYCLKLALGMSPKTNMYAAFLFLAAQAGVFINLILGVFNLFPIPPLDGSRVLSSILPPKYSLLLYRIEPFGFIILVALLITGVLGRFIQPLLKVGYGVLNWILGF